jgi:hypothetical protein
MAHITYGMGANNNGSIFWDFSGISWGLNDVLRKSAGVVDHQYDDFGCENDG